MLRFARRRDRRASGQIIVLFVLSLTAIFAMAALLFDGAHALVLRRQIQNAGDSAALQAANLIRNLKGCSATYVMGSAPGSPRAAITTAAQTAVQAALPGTPASAIHVSCPDGIWNNYAVQVDVDGHSPTFFGGAVGIRGFDVKTTSQAVNGPVAPAPYSVILLDNSNSSWPNGRRGCPAALISGGPTVIFEGSMMIDSACTAANGGGLGTNGNSATLTFNNSAVIKIVGGYAPAALTITPTPTTGAAYVKDPLLGLPAMPSTLPVRFASRQVYGGSDVVLEPGVYVGGIQLKNSVKAFLHPGVYEFRGGGFDIGAQNAVYSVATGVTTTTEANWATNCPVASCGVLFYNSGTTSTMGQVTVGAGATLKLRPYNSTYDGAGANQPDYNNLLLWQSGTPAPSNSFEQPVVSLSGGGSVDISGTVYAPGAVVFMTGGSGGSGGGTDLTLQFICWDLQIQGNSSFHFFYQNNSFAHPPDYGLIK
ncbi:MAG TPA: Tad domain-containing protein [Candidatus Limnocylindrales bacterium]|nr:Tad domain-containing protein [Candidatus Limnocylindrales bacterium]